MTARRADAGSARLTSPDKVLWPAVAITKAQLWRYLDAVAERMLPTIEGRPLTLRRHPSGIDAEGFLQKNLGAGAPDWLPRHRMWSPSSNRRVVYPLAEHVDDLRWMGNQNTVEWHSMLVRADRDDRPDLVAFDLDPPEHSGPGELAAAAWAVREVLDSLDLAALVKTSGKRGLHLLVPIQRRYPFEYVRAFGLAVARLCARTYPDLTVAMRKSERGGRLLLDWSRNGPAQTVVSAWSPRVTPTATVSTPLRWEEVTETLDPAAFTISSVVMREDAWADPPAPKRLERAVAALARGGIDLVDASPRSTRIPE